MKNTHKLLCAVLPTFIALAFNAQGSLVVNRTVTNTADSGSGSLRATLQLAASAPGAETVLFAPELSGQTITLTSELSINDADGVIVDATSLPRGITLTDAGDVNHRLVMVQGGNATFQGFTFANGGGNLFAANNHSGGAILNNGNLQLDRCTFTGNMAASGGAISSVTAPDFVSTKTLLNYCTLSGNTATLRGGSIDNEVGSTAIIHCTITGNSAPANSGSGVASAGNILTETFVRYSLIAANANSDVDFNQGIINSFSSQGSNIVGAGSATGAFNRTGDQINPPNLNLSPLGNYGGPSQTVALRPMSAARNAAIGSIATTDQRDFPVIATPDVGAYEAGTTRNFNSWILETLPASATPQQYDASFDFDGDGQSNALEYATLGNPSVPNHGQNLIFSRNTSGNLATFVMPYRYSASSLSYRIERSINLAAWTPVANVDSATNLIYPAAGVSLTSNTATSLTLTDNFISGKTKVFYRLNATVGAP